MPNNGYQTQLWMTDATNMDIFFSVAQFQFDFGWRSHQESFNAPMTRDHDSGPWTQQERAEIQLFTKATLHFNFQFFLAYNLDYTLEFYPIRIVPIGLLFQWDRVTKDNEEMRLFMASYYVVELLILDTLVSDNAATWGTSVWDWFFNDQTKISTLWPTSS